jgi:flagella basal body P-ring formation protein FlgA
MNRISNSLCRVAVACLAGVCCSMAAAAEIHLRPEVRTEKTLLLLGDVAEIFAADPQETQTLAALELVPAPPQGQKLAIRIRDIQDLLSIRGVNLADCQFSGAAQVLVTAVGPSDERHARAMARRPAKLLVQQAQHVAEEAIIRCLQDKAPDEGDWQVRVELNEQQLAPLASASDTVVATGGERPWTGRQEFELAVPSVAGPATLHVAALVSLPPAVVVTVHPLEKGSFVRANDVQLQRLKAGQTPGSAFQTIADAVGKEAVRGLPAGQTLDANLVRAPLLVSTGEVVTVFGRNSGIVVRMPARARDNGSRGDLVTVESLTDRKTFLARVTDLHEVEVFAGASTTSPEAGYTSSRPAAAAAPVRRAVRQAAAAAE